MTQILETIGQSWFWKYFFSHFGWVDWILSIFILVGIIMGLKHGLSQELPRLLEIFISLYVTFQYYSFFSDWITRETPLPESYARPFMFGLVAVINWVALRLLFEILGKFIHLQIANPFQILGGLMIGAFRYFLIFSLISYTLVLFPPDWVNRAYRVQSWSGHVLTQFPQKIHSWINGVIVPKVQA